MPGSPELIADLLKQAKAARAAHQPDEARAAYAKSYDKARTANDVTAMAEAALGLAALHVYGTHAGRAPAYLYEAYKAADGPQRIRLAAALARVWVYSGDFMRAVDFADEALIDAEALGDQSVLAEALDAKLLVSWGPDDFDERVRLSARLEDTVAHLVDVEARMLAHLWRLTTAVETLDPVTARRQVRALQVLADESGSARVRFYAASRAAMQALVDGDVEAARDFREAAIRAGEEAGEADTLAVDHVLAGEIALREDDRDRLRKEAAAYEEYSTAEGVPSTLAEAAEVWTLAGETEHARELLNAVAGGGLAEVPRNQNWLGVIAALTRTAARVGDTVLAEEGYQLLEPYAGRGIPNGGALALMGVVDGYLADAADALGRGDDAQRHAGDAVALFERFGSRWHADGYRALAAGTTNGSAVAAGGAGAGAGSGAGASATTQRVGVRRAVLRPAADGVWAIGWDGAVAAVREVKGFAYLRLLVSRPDTDVSALDLSNAVAGHSAAAAIADASLGDGVDKQALDAYRRRIRELDAELAEADEWADEGRAARLRDERAALLDEVAAATGLGGRPRQVGATTERARVAVRKAVAAAIERISDVDAPLGRLLNDCVQTGAICRYRSDPDRPVEWIVD